MSEDKYGPEQRAMVMDFQRWKYRDDWTMIDVSHDGKPVIDLGVLNPINTRYIGTIAFQGTDKEIEAMQRRTFGKEERQ